MAKVRIEYRGGFAFAYLDGKPLREGETVHFARGHRPADVPARGGKFRFKRALWTSVVLQRDDGSRFDIPIDAADLVRG